MAFYDSRHRPTTYSIAKPTDNKPMVLTHSSYWLERNKAQQSENLKAVDKKSDTNTLSDKSHGDPGKDSGAKTEGTEVSRCMYFKEYLTGLMYLYILLLILGLTVT
jgi:hypothetical protein